MTKTNLRAAFLLLLAFLHTTTTVLAQDSAEVLSTAGTENAEERINFAGKLRMLSQRIPSAACHLSRGVDVEGSSELLVAATAEFDKILIALELGDVDLNIQEPQLNRRTLAMLATLRSAWEPFRAAVDALIAGEASDDEIAYILTNNIPVLQAAQRVVESHVRQYANPNAASAAALITIDISGRQRMLTQKMSSESCMLGGTFVTTTTLDDLKETMHLFEVSLDALRFGMIEVGVIAPPNPQISDGLESVLNDWYAVKPHMMDLLNGAELKQEARSDMFRGLNVTMANMNKVVGMYAATAR